MKLQSQSNVNVHRDLPQLCPWQRMFWGRPLTRLAATHLSLWLLAFTCPAQTTVVDESLIHSFLHQYLDGNYMVRDVAPDPNGGVYAVGNFDIVDGQTTGNVVRFKSDGGLDSDYPQGGEYDGDISVCILQKDGKLLIGALTQPLFNGERIPYLARLTTDGRLDEEFDVGEGPYNIDFTTRVYDILINDTDEIYVAGSFNFWDLQEEVGPVVRLEADGALDKSFKTEITRSGIGREADVAVYSISHYPDGRLLIGGNFDHVNGLPYNCVARLNADGSIDETFHPGAGPGFDLLPGFSPSVNAAVLQPDGRIILTGSITTFDGTPVTGILRLNDNGSVDHSFSVNMVNTGEGPYSYNGSLVFDMTVDSQGRIVVTGSFNEVNEAPRQGVVRLLPDGRVDHGFDPGNAFINLLSMNAISIPGSVATDADDRVVLGGNFIRPDQTSAGLIRFNTILPAQPEIVDFSFETQTGGWIEVANPARDVLVLMRSTDFLEWSAVSSNSLRENSVRFEIPFKSAARQEFFRVMAQP